ncbi:lysostaphin resistance A-like protein [Peribacillus sp. SCS-26]|uniref:CPBP family intramembrane glutamic endopeptidase n=1 Tax=Paraperibacillus marinus TaxID=3115295 RepID=UPI003905A631
MIREFRRRGGRKINPQSITRSEAKTSNMTALIHYLFIFYCVWAFKELILAKYFYTYGEPQSALIEALLKIFIWIVPAWLYIKYYIFENPITYLKLNVQMKKGMIWGFTLSLLLAVYFIIEVYILHERVFHFLLTLDSCLNTFILAGITEELVFRGLILQEINRRTGFWKANGITSLLFLFIHYPVWIHNGEFFNWGSHVNIFILSLFFGFVYKKTGSMWSVVILHSFYNFFLIII